MNQIDISNVVNRATKQQLAEWVEALRSGIYGQTTGHLCCNNKYCCLGVFGELRKLDFILEDGECESKIKKYNLGDFFASETFMKGAAEMNIVHYFPRFIQTKLASLNDQYHWDFVKIAQYVEENIKIDEDGCLFVSDDLIDFADKNGYSYTIL